MLRATFRQLEIFKTVSELGSFTDAAESLDISQVAISRHVAALEKALERKLFERSRGRHSKLSADGIELLAQIPALIDAARNISRTRSGSSTQLIRIAAGETLLENYFHPALAEFQSRNPSIIIEWIEAPPSLRSLQGLREMGADLAFFTLLDPPDRVPGDCLGRCSASLYGSPDHQDIGAIEDRTHIPLIMSLAGSPTERMMIAALAGIGVTGTTVARAQRSTHRCELAARGIGFCLVQDDTAAPFVDKGQLAKVPLPIKQAYRYGFTLNRPAHPAVIMACGYFSALLADASIN